MKSQFVPALVFFLSSIHAFASSGTESEVWNSLPSWDGGCFREGGRKATEVAAKQNTMEGEGRKAVPVAKMESGDIVLPNCKNVLYRGVNEGEYFAVSNTSAYFSGATKPGKKRKWKTLIDYKEKLLGLGNVRMAFNPAHQVAAFVGHTPTSGVNSNYLVIWNLPKKSRVGRMEIGTGYYGMSGVMMNPERKEIIVASADWCAQVVAYDYGGKVVREFPGINRALKAKGLCLGMHHTWEWNVDFGRDSTTGEFLFHFSTSNDEGRPGPESGYVYRLDLEQDLLIN